MEGPHYQHHHHHDSLFFRRHRHPSSSTGSGDAGDKGEYGLVMTTFRNHHGDNDDGDDDIVGSSSGNFDDDDDDDVDEQGHDNMLASIVSPTKQQQQPFPAPIPMPLLQGWKRILLTPLLPDDRFMMLGGTMPLLDGVKSVRCLKFFVITWMGLIGMFTFVRWMNLEHDESYSISDMILYDGQPILTDTMFFFLVGRLYDQRGVDHIAWVGVMLMSGLFDSLETYVPFLQNSVTLYAMHCIWPWQLWLFVVLMLILCSMVLVWHVQYMTHHNLWGIKSMEIVASVILFLLPPLSSPYFHFHHWFAGWLVGMHCNFDVWWSRLTMAWCWGAYINGIAVYGRDPILTCDYAFYLSYNLRCPYLHCYIDALTHPNTTDTTVQIMQAQDWRNCSAADYVP